MSDAIVEEFAEQLASLAHAFEGRPRDELDALWTLGIEREAIVTVAYRAAVIEQRLARMPIDDDARAVIARAIRWAWRDEEAHTLWVRGALMRRTELGQRARAMAAQIEGWVGGWVSSRQNHLGWSEAPVSRLIAEGLETVGVISGRIPAAVRDVLHWNTFADFCRFNRSAETTAAMAWRRMAELASTHEVAAPEEAEGFRRMALDEERHAKIFTVLSEALDDADRLSISTDTLRARLHAVGERFVALPDAGGPAWRNPLGKGGTVVVREGGGATAVVAAVLETMGLDEVLASASPVVDRPLRVAIKTTFMLVADRRDPSPGVSIRVLAAVLDWLRARGAVPLVIDARNYYDEFRGHRTVLEVARYLGLDESAEVVDAETDLVTQGYARGMGIGTVVRTWRDADVRILLGKLRSHPTATALLSLESAEGLGARIGDHLFVERRGDREMAALMALDALPPHAALLDAWEHVPDGLMGILGSERPLHPRRIYGCRDAVALDAVVSRHIGAEPAREGTLLAHAFDWFGDPRARLVVDGPDTPIAGFRLPDHSAVTALLSALALPVFTYASLRGELFLPDFDEAAFPPIEPESAVVRATRAAIRRVVADEAPAAIAGAPIEDGSNSLQPTVRPEQTRASAMVVVEGREGMNSLLSTTVLRAPEPVRIARLGKGPPVVLLHGYPETLQIWARVAPLLAAHREVIAFDWPGLGYSVRCLGAADPDALAEQLVRVLDRAGLARVDLVGADMGAPPALVLASRHPDRVGTVVVMSALLFGDEATSVEISVMRRAGLASAAFRVAPGLVYARCKRTFLDDGETLPAALDADFANAFHRPEVRDHLIRMCADYERALPRLPDRYWTIRNPVRLLWAEDDGHFPPRQAERMCELLPGARRVVLTGARHWMAHSRAQEVAAEIGRFLDERT